MKSLSCPAFVVLLFVQSVCNCSGTLSPMLMASGAADSDKTGCYIVVLKEDTTHERFLAIKSQVVSMTEDEKLHGSVEAIVKAFTVKLPDHALSIVSVVDNIILNFNCCSIANVVISYAKSPSLSCSSTCAHF